MNISTIFVYIAILIVIIKLYNSYTYYIEEDDNYILRQKILINT